MIDFLSFGLMTRWKVERWDGIELMIGRNLCVMLLQSEVNLLCFALAED